MAARVAALPRQLRDAWDLAADGPDLLGGARPARLYVCGMGGSAIGGDFLKAMADAEGEVAVTVIRGYELPRPAARQAFALFVSYSGGTEETLAAWDDARRRGVPRAAVTGGGPLAERAAAEGVPCLRIPPGSPPRAALGWTTVPLLQALSRAGLLACSRPAVLEAESACEEIIARHGPDAPAADPLRGWAEACVGKLPVVYAPAVPYAPCAVRWGTQLNENAKTLAHVALFPEQNHNEIVGWETPSPVRSLAAVALLGAKSAPPRMRRRMEIVAAAVQKAGALCAAFEPAGRGLAARLFSLAALGDLASLHLAAALDVDPTPVSAIDRLKQELGSTDRGA
jgi:glucose/mannose-6-phosphate isomerase